MENELTTSGNFEVIPCEQMADIETRPGFKKLELTSAQKIQIGGLLQQMPALVATSVLSSTYMVRFPDGVSNVLTPLKQGGFGTMVKDEAGKFAGSASLYPVEAQTAVLGAFSAMSIASGQYFLAQINNELKTMNQSIDKILEFLYGDKKAELISEVSFVKSAYQNYNSIMGHEQQRFATLVSLQEARKVAMKDIEFYMSDLDSTVNTKGGSDIVSLTDKICQIKECLELSIQLYSMSSLLEVYYAQNYDPIYICHIEEDAVTYIGKCEKRMLSCFSRLSSHIQNYKEGPLKKVDKPALEKRVNLVVDAYSRGTESEILKSIRAVLHGSEAKAEYYVTNNSELYLKAV